MLSLPFQKYSKQKIIKYMKIIFYEVLLTLLIAATSCSLLKPVNYLNGGFEIAANNLTPDGWFANNLPQTKNFAQLTLDNSVAHSGNNSIKISISKKHPSQSLIYNWVHRLGELKEGDNYELQGWIKLMNIKSVPFIKVDFWNNDILIGTASIAKKTINIEYKEWQLVKTIFYVPKAVSKIFITFGINGMGNNGGVVWFDDLSVKKITIS